MLHELDEEACAYIYTVFLPASYLSPTHNLQFSPSENMHFSFLPIRECASTLYFGLTSPFPLPRYKIKIELLDNTNQGFFFLTTFCQNNAANTHDSCKNCGVKSPLHIALH